MCCGLLISAGCPTLQPALALPTKQGRSPVDTRHGSPLLRRFAPRAGFAARRQTFVRCGQKRQHSGFGPSQPSPATAAGARGPRLPAGTNPTGLSGGIAGGVCLGARCASSFGPARLAARRDGPRCAAVRVMDPSLLYESPFTDFDSKGVEGFLNLQM